MHGYVPCQLRDPDHENNDVTALKMLTSVCGLGQHCQHLPRHISRSGLTQSWQIIQFLLFI